jgi:hypothetical protein
MCLPTSSLNMMSFANTAAALHQQHRCQYMLAWHALVAANQQLLILLACVDDAFATPLGVI